VAPRRDRDLPNIFVEPMRREALVASLGPRARSFCGSQALLESTASRVRGRGTAGTLVPRLGLRFPQIPAVALAVAFDENPNWKRGRAIVWHHRNRARANIHCLYCDTFLGPGTTATVTKEHLIGRRFVPKGSLDSGQRFNFIFSACDECNGHKARFEDHVSAVCMMWSRRAAEEPSFLAEAFRKTANSYHPLRPGVKIADASEHPRISGSFGDANVQMTFAAPPRIDQSHVSGLAAMHVQALYSLATTRDHRSRESLKRLAPTNIWILDWYPASDWGNPALVEARKRITRRPPVITVNAAEGAFRATLRRDYAEQPWCWALEWNHAIRVIGAIGDFDSPPSVLAGIQPPRWTPLADGWRFRPEVPAAEPDDLFSDDVSADD
jgi:hypothetical protein